MNALKFDLIVIGAGPGGYVAAIRAAQLGLKVACIEKDPALGGTCLRVGCIPSKALLESSESFHRAQHELAGMGVITKGVSLDLAAMMRRKSQVVETLVKGVAALFKKNNISRYEGTAKLETPQKVIITGSKEHVVLEAPKIIVATGSKPANLPGIEIDGSLVGTSTDALAYSEVPKELVVIGAGYIGLELGSVWQRLGSHVTILEFQKRILFGLDGELAAEAQKSFAKQGLDFRLGTKVKSVRTQDKICTVEMDGVESIRCDRVLVAVGRVPNTAGLGLEDLEIELNKNGSIPVDANFKTKCDGVYAIGDVVAGPMLAHKAEEEGIACVERMVTGYGHVDYNTIAGVVYTHPQIAFVGKTEEQLEDAKIGYKKGSFPFRANARARTLEDVEGFVKVLADAQSDRILGVHIIGPNAGDLINEASAAIAFGASSEDLARTCHAHPTLGEALREAALAVDGRAIHI
jgi:dihydrolipoamide dehydrogenase